MFRAFADGNGGVVLHLESGQYHGINEVGCLVWELIDGERTIDDVVADVGRAVDDAPPELAADIERFLTDMQARDLVLV